MKKDEGREKDIENNLRHRERMKGHIRVCRQKECKRKRAKCVLKKEREEAREKKWKRKGKKAGSKEDQRMVDKARKKERKNFQ